MDKASACSAGATGDLGTVLVLGRSPGGENGNPSQDLAWEKNTPGQRSLLGLQSMESQSDMTE